MGNQMENAMKAAGIAAGESLGAKVDDALDALESAIDSVTETADNNTDGADDAQTGQEERPATVEELQGIIDGQNERIERLIGIMGKMVTRQGAQLSDIGQAGNDPFGGSEDAGENEQPNLDEIRLGSM